MAANNVRLVARARAHGNELFKSGNFAEACIAYGEGLKYDSYNPVLYCNRAACRFKLGQWEKSVEDCNEALRIQPSYTKAHLRRAASYAKVKILLIFLLVLFRICINCTSWSILPYNIVSVILTIWSLPKPSLLDVNIHFSTIFFPCDRLVHTSHANSVGNPIQHNLRI